MTGRAAGWNDGYVVDVTYTEPIFASLCPAQISMSAVLNGQPPLPTDHRLTWVDLGAGNGLPACMVAAANPNIDVFGYDFNPAHVERARTLASKAGLDNCHFDEASFAELAAGTVPCPREVDVIMINGVYSWISRANQVHIGEIVRHVLRPGGVAFVGYTSPGGWSAMTPVAEALHLRARVDPRRSDLAFSAAAAEITELAQQGARYFPLSPFEAGTFDQLGGADARYGAHEYLGAHFRPLLFPEVADVMAHGRCSYLGPIEATGRLSRLGASPELAALVNETPHERVREILRDLVAQRPLRRDLFRRGLATPNAIERNQWLQGLAVVGVDATVESATTVGVPLGTVDIHHDFYSPLLDLLREQPVTVADIRAVHPNVSFQDAVGSLAVLVGAGYAVPAAAVLGATVADGSAARRLNTVLIEENSNGGDHRSLVSPLTGGALGSEYCEMLTIGHVWAGADRDADLLADLVIADLQRQGRLVREKGELVQEWDVARGVVHDRVERTFERMDGIFRRHGIC
jgi:SAM-dependent methyltransferase